MTPGNRTGRSQKGIVLLLGVLVAAFLYGSYRILLRRTSEKLIWAMSKSSHLLGAKELQAWYDGVGFRFPARLEWRAAGAKLLVGDPTRPGGTVDLLVRADRIAVAVQDLVSQTARIEVFDATIQPIRVIGATNQSSDERRRPGTESFRLDIEHATLPFSFSVNEPATTLRNILSAAAALADGERIPAPFTLDGTLTFALGASRHSLHLAPAKDEAGWHVALDRNELERITSGMSESFSAPEIDLISSYPARAHQLMEIKERARRRSEEAREVDRQVPEDAYRHVLWSFLLTRQFGADFAERVTTAHEVGVAGTAKAADSSKDYHNNELGRRWAVAGVAESDLLHLVKSSPLVLRD